MSSSVFVNVNFKKSIKSVLFIGDDSDYAKSLIEKSNNEILNISFFEENKFQLLSNTINSFDLIVFDKSKISLEKFIQSFKLSQSYEINIPMIVLEDELSNDLSLYKYGNTILVLERSIKEDLLLANIELCVNFLSNNSRKYFEDGFYYDINRDLLFKGKELIKLTKTERGLIKLLSENVNMLVTYEEISETVWEGKNFSIFSLRNVVKHIREKTTEELIQNSSNRGYIIKTI